MKNRKEKGRALFYTRDSGGKHETTPSEYVGWANRTAEELGLKFTGTPDGIDAMIRNGESVGDDMFLDFGVAGNILSRKGLNAMIDEVTRDGNVSHVLIPRRNRLARPNHAVDGLKLEHLLRQQGVAIVFMDKTLLPQARGKRSNVAEEISAIIDYDRSSEDRRELAQKVLYAQLSLAKAGFSTGGRPPYGFRRWLAKMDGALVRQLNEGEYIKMRGHHVIWMPGDEHELNVIRRILLMLESMPATQVAKTLTEEGVPTPDQGRYRTDNGVRHLTSGVWHQTTIINIARNPLLLAIVEYGRRSMGDQLRFTPNGPRELTDPDFRDDDKPKVIRNQKENRIAAPANFDTLVDENRHRKLLGKLDKRAGTQQGKPRSRDPNKNPLGGQVFDINCRWPMYRVPYLDSFRYTCGLYQQSHGAQCNHNHIDGPTATRFVLSCIRQYAVSPKRMKKLEDRIRGLAANDKRASETESEVNRKRHELSQVEAQLEQVSQNLARAKTEEEYKAISAIFRKLSEQAKSLQAEVIAAERQRGDDNDVESAIDSAIKIVHQLPELADWEENLGMARQIIELLNARLFLIFQKVQGKKRILNKLSHGVATLGSVKPPIEIYNGPTARGKINDPAAKTAAWTPTSSICPDGEDKSLGNVSRGERI